MYKIIILLIAFGTIEITAMKRAAAPTTTTVSLLEESLPQLKQAKALIDKYTTRMYVTRDDIAQEETKEERILGEDLNKKLEEICCTPPLFHYITRQLKKADFKQSKRAHIKKPILHPLEKICYLHMQTVPFRRHGRCFALDTDPDELARMFSLVKEESYDKPCGVFVKWIFSPKKQYNPTRALLNTLHTDLQKTLYVVTPQTGPEHSNLIITRLAHNQQPCAFLIDSSGEGFSRISFLNKRPVNKTDATVPNNLDPDILIIDSSLDKALALQNAVENDDYNCHFYTLCYTLVAKKFLLDQSSPAFKEFEELCTRKCFTQAGKLLHESLIPSLTRYFRKDDRGRYIPKKTEEIMDAHLMARWIQGNNYLRERAAALSE
jgi:hypothetical protein